MKKLFIFLATIIFIIASTAQCFAYTKTAEWKWYVGDGCYYPIPYIETTDYITRNGTAMVKLRDMVGAIGGSVEYNSATKTTKAYFPENQMVASVAIKTNSKNITYNNRINYRYTHEYSSYYASVAPTIVNGSLYIAALDLGNVLAKGHESTMLDGKTADIRNGKLIILYGYDMQG